MNALANRLRRCVSNLMIRSKVTILAVLFATSGWSQQPTLDEKILLQVPPKEAVADALKSGDKRYLSVVQCNDMILGYSVPAGDVSKIEPPWKQGVKKFGPSCETLLGEEASQRLNALQEYVSEYNRLMFEQLNFPHGKK
ncbi:MAG: hypothetical protein V4568_01720 [Pseudomonadota bacterium]